METRVILAVTVFSILAATLFFGDSTITGYVPSETYQQELDIEVYESQRFRLSSDEALRLSSFSISGEVFGVGLVNIYLSDGNTIWLVFSNKKKTGSAMEHITGFAIGGLNIKSMGKINKIETLPEGFSTLSGKFYNECSETCVLDEAFFNKKELYLDIIIEPGAIVSIDKIKFTAG